MTSRTRPSVRKLVTPLWSMSVGQSICRCCRCLHNGRTRLPIYVLSCKRSLAHRMWLRQRLSDFARFWSFRSACGDILSFSTRPPWRASYFSLRGQREVSKRKATPTLAPYAQSLCYGFASLLRGSPTVHPWTGVELAHIVWAILQTFPAQSRRDRGAPCSARRARLSQSQKPLIRSAGHLLPLHGRRKRRSKATACGNLLRLGCAGCAVNGPPERRRSGVGKPGGWLAGMRASLASVHGWTVDKPRSHFANSEGRKPVERRFGVAFS